MSTRSSAPRGVLMAGVGAFVALASLWLPWYTIKLPEAFRDALGSIGTGSAGSAAGNAAAGGFAGLFKGLAAALPSEITGKGWQVMSGGDVALAVAAVAALLLALSVAGGFSGVRIENSVAGRLISLAGLVVTGIALYHVVSKPGAGEGGFSTIVTVKIGIWVATAGGLSMIVGGLLTARPPKAADAEFDMSPTFEPPEAETMPDPFAAPMPMPEPAAETAPAPDPFAAPAPEPDAAPDPFAAPATASLATPDPFADPVAQSPTTSDPFALPAQNAFATPDPFAAPAEDAFVTPDPFAAPPQDSYATRDPFAAPAEESSAAPDPFAAPADPVMAPAAEAPEWQGFTTPTPNSEPEPALEPVGIAGVAPEPSAPRPAGVSVPPPGWTGAT